MSDPPVREAGTVQADVDELVLFLYFKTNYSKLYQHLHINWSGVQVEGKGLLHQLNLCKLITIGQSFILGQPWVKIKILFDKTFILKGEAASLSFLSVMPAIVNI